MKRVVITGMGIACPLGLGVDHAFKRLINAESGVIPIPFFDTSDYTSKIAGIIPRGSKVDGCFSVEEWIDVKEARRLDDFIIYGLVSATEAVEDAGLDKIIDEGLKERIGVCLGSGIGGLESIHKSSDLVTTGELRKVSPFFIPSALINLLSGHVSIKYGFKGPNTSVVTACATGTHSIGDGFRIIRNNEADIMVCGGAEAPVTRLGVTGFMRLQALSTSYNDKPAEASRPWDSGRDGFVIAEGAGTLILEEYEHAKKRGAKIYGEVVGYGMSGDAYHITAPSEGGEGAYRCMKVALKSAGISAEEIKYVNAHGTSTPKGDEIELSAVKRLLGDSAKNAYMSSNKSAMGHQLGATGAVEAIFTIKAMQTGIIPPTLNLHDPIPDAVIDLVPLKAKEVNIEYALSNSFGFGGTNASLIFKKI